MIKRRILGIFRRMGYELVPCPARTTIEGTLHQAASAGLAAATVIDVGAASGGFARLCAEILPKARLVLIEPLAEFTSALAGLDALHIAAAAGASDGDMVFNVHPDLYGSSLCLEDEGTDVNGTPRTVALRRLDGLAAEHGLCGPYLLKIDVQGAERQVLAGAEKVLANTAMAIVETSFLPFFQGGTLAAELIAMMEAAEFVVYDIVGLAHRPLDGALAQADLVFVPRDSPLRRDHRYATPQQRAALTRRLQAAGG